MLDRQQLTARYYVCVAPDVPLPERTNRAIYFINVDHFMREEYDNAFGYDWKTKRIEKLNPRPIAAIPRAHLPAFSDRCWRLGDTNFGTRIHEVLS